MSTRREFLQKLAGTLAVAAAAEWLPGCAAGLPAVHGEWHGEAITIPQAAATALAAPGGVLLVRPPNFPVTIVVRRLADQRLLALSTVCSHAGCEVRVLPNALQCPCHGSEYDVTGAVVEGPASRALQSFPVTEDQNSITIRVKS
ncbi:MAG: Rieske (2Fe-2S) protein [candidate division KSB1 bacterium]|nr:Rieske (2Fe-2S) protein [candidate division KSB1 bacterium]MDZ7274706.1 Rieske (2Fe-2S) protein [candidate division KSB1 bacterium]MDZ7285531.1 Rieske (2Fe-2S) protein [candidate division KSB1 bacterium]MDZ7298563.1 Rieske (2Fe-2S) protein [candidate division KSB1 bacterium]MDZ7306585.1 Rieske (2Fe-2S) protein [candidate division KSB1 bacterium]